MHNVLYVKTDTELLVEKVPIGLLNWPTWIRPRGPHPGSYKLNVTQRDIYLVR